MFSSAKTVTIRGVEAYLTKVECLTSRGIPNLYISGGADRHMKESVRKVISACKPVIGSLSAKKIRINFASDQISKSGAHYDLAVAVALIKNLALDRIAPAITDQCNDIFAFGQIDLNGDIRMSSGLIHFLDMCHHFHGSKLILTPILPPNIFHILENLFSSLDIMQLENIHQLTRELYPAGTSVKLKSRPITSVHNSFPGIARKGDTKRIIASLGRGESILTISERDSTITAKIQKVLSSSYMPMKRVHLIEVVKISDILGKELLRAPVAVVNEITAARKLPELCVLAHRGFLFFHNIFDASQLSLNCLADIMHRKSACINGFTFPADFTLVAVGSKCPCRKPIERCSCTAEAKVRYRSKLPRSLEQNLKIIS